MDQEEVINVDPQELLQAYSDELAQAHHKMLMQGLAIKQLREQVGQLETELAKHIGPKSDTNDDSSG